MHISIIENLYNTSTYQIIKIMTVLHTTYLVPKNQEKFVFYINNYIN